MTRTGLGRARDLVADLSRSASSAPSPPTQRRPRRAPVAPGRRLARPRAGTRRVGHRAGAHIRFAHPRLRHDRPLPHRPQTRRRRRLRPPRRRGAQSRGCASCSTACSTTSVPTSPATGRRWPGATQPWFRTRRQRFRDLRGPRRADRAQPRQPGGRRLHRRRDVALAAPRRRRLAAGRRLRGAGPVLGPGAAPGALASSGTPGSSARSSTATTGDRDGRNVRLGHPVRAVEGDLEQPQRRATSTNSTMRCGGTTSSSTRSCR